MVFDIIPGNKKYRKAILFLFIVILPPIILIPHLTNDVTIIVYVSSSLTAIFIACLSLIAARMLSDKTSSEVTQLVQKIDYIIGKVDGLSTKPKTPAPIDPTQLSYIMKEWEIVIQTQMHFNDLLMKMRTATLSIVLAIFGAAGYSILSKETYLLTINDFSFHPSVIIISAGLVLLFSMFIMDYFYYFRLLVGAVKRGWEFDDKFGTEDTWKYFGLTTKISHEIGEKKGNSKWFVISFYWIPFVAGLFFLFAILFGFPVSNTI